jgi:CspA family cold shock protein
MPTGIVKFFNEEKGFGFISTDTDGDIFVHTSSIEQSDQRGLVTGQNVQFDIGEGRKGPEAINVRVV